MAPPSSHLRRAISQSCGEARASPMTEHNAPAHMSSRETLRSTQLKSLPSTWPEGDYGILSAQGASAYLYQLEPPYQGAGYYFKEALPSGGVPVFKIYDTDETCTNANALRDPGLP
ncbi:hypothetical protein MTO96_006017 [Rhipicephalus appendiculatus]